MRKSEVQALIALIFGRLQIRLFILPRHGVPNCLSLLVDRHIEDLRTDEQHKIVRTNGNKHLVSAAVQWLIIFAVDILRDDAAGLYCHIVQSRCNSTCPDGACIARSDGDQDGVDVRVTYH